MQDLSWEDKELVLRVLFAKMNGLQQNVNNAVTRSRREGGRVFVTEGIVDGASGADGGGDLASKFNEIFPDNDTDEYSDDGNDGKDNGDLSIIDLA